MSELFKGNMLTEPVSGNLITGGETAEEKKKREENYKNMMLNEVETNK